MQLAALTLTLALFHGVLAKPVYDLQVLVNGGSTNAPQQMLQDAWVTRNDILEGKLVHSTTVNLDTICPWIRFPTAGSQPEEQCALVPQAPFSTSIDHTDQKLCVKIEVDESAQDLCNGPQPQGQVDVVVVEASDNTDVHYNTKDFNELSLKEKMNVLLYASNKLLHMMKRQYPQMFCINTAIQTI
ncbi:hypothetical protein H4R35_005234 [Dimargaris xerosporica]|nr:hypothetical protein H4R35_005234 [Dimargaris xerosporica]